MFLSRNQFKGAFEKPETSKSLGDKEKIHPPII